MNVATLMSLFKQTLDRNDEFFVNYEQLAENTVQITFSGTNLDQIDVLVGFGITDDEFATIIATVSCYDLPNFADNTMAGLIACNKLNDEECIKFYIDEDNDVVAYKSQIFRSFGFQTEFCAELVLQEAVRVYLSVDDAYPILTKARWSD